MINYIYIPEWLPTAFYCYASATIGFVIGWFFGRWTNGNGRKNEEKRGDTPKRGAL